MRIGLDIASITLKKQANIIVLVSDDSDFVPAAKLARREGVRFILDPLWQNVPARPARTHRWIEKRFPQSPARGIPCRGGDLTASHRSSRAVTLGDLMAESGA